MNHLRRAHLALGIAGLVAFLATGLYMDRYHDHLRGYSEVVRMLFRSAHIYLLWSALLNVAVGLYLRAEDAAWRRAAQAVGSVAWLAGPPLLLAAFATEPWLTGLDRPWARPALYMALAGGVLHLLAAARWPLWRRRE